MKRRAILFFLLFLLQMGSVPTLAAEPTVAAQGAALIDGSTLGAMAPYLLTDYNGAKVPESFGTGWRAATTSNNIARLNDAVEEGFYLFLFLYNFNVVNYFLLKMKTTSAKKGM